jgi:SRSO17 transposase
VQNNLIEIYDDSMIGMILHEQFLKKYPEVKSIKISGKNPKYERILKRNKSITNSTVILNMPIVKSSIVLSQLRAHDMNATKSLSTQINYSPLLFVLTQKEDRKDFYVTNAIDKLPDNIEEMNLLFENDILYNWVNYSTILGLEYLLTDANKLFNKINIVDNQIEYNLKILKAQENKFVHYRNVK